MGTPLPPNEPAVPCPTCWGPGKPFGDSVTPHAVSLTFTGLKPAEFWIPAAEQSILIPHLCVNTGSPCQWHLFFGNYAIALVWGPAGTILSFTNTATSRFLFLHQALDACLHGYPNDLVEPVGRQAFGGSVSITWSLEGLS